MRYKWLLVTQLQQAEVKQGIPRRELWKIRKVKGKHREQLRALTDATASEADALTGENSEASS